MTPQHFLAISECLELTPGSRTRGSSGGADPTKGSRLTARSGLVLLVAGFVTAYAIAPERDGVPAEQQPGAQDEPPHPNRAGCRAAVAGNAAVMGTP